MTIGRDTLLCGVMVTVMSFGGPTVAHAEASSENRMRFDPTLVEQWKEVEVAPPAYPRNADLIAVALGPADTLKLFIDARSVSRASDRVLRLTLVVESRSGARTVFFDGIRCETRQYKTYATGSADERLLSVNEPRWQEIPRWPQNNFRDHLLRHYACTDTSSAREPEEFLKQLRH